MKGLVARLGEEGRWRASPPPSSWVLSLPVDSSSRVKWDFACIFSLLLPAGPSSTLASRTRLDCLPQTPCIRLCETLRGRRRRRPAEPSAREQDCRLGVLLMEKGGRILRCSRCLFCALLVFSSQPLSAFLPSLPFIFLATARLGQCPERFGSLGAAHDVSAAPSLASSTPLFFFICAKEQDRGTAIRPWLEGCQKCSPLAGTAKPLASLVLSGDFAFSSIFLVLPAIVLLFHLRILLQLPFLLFLLSLPSVAAYQFPFPPWSWFGSGLASRNRSPLSRRSGLGTRVV